MAKIVTTDRFVGGQGIAKNSLDVKYGDLLAIKSGFIDKAVVGDRIEWISVETKVFSATNQTVGKVQLQYARAKDEMMFEIETTADLAQVNVGNTFNLNTSGVVNIATAGTGDQLRLREIVGKRLGLFVRAK